jgi:hypothetical protein
MLGDRRLPDTPVKPIIPVFFRKTDLPQAAGARQAIDLSRISLQGRRYYSTKEFRSAILKIADQIIEIATALLMNHVRAQIEHFVLPERSAFGQSLKQPPPFRAE